MLKSILIAMGLAFGVAAHATETVTPLNRPLTTQTGGLVATCEAFAFGASDAPFGTCQTAQNKGGGRYPTFLYTWYATSWDLLGNVTNVTPCGSQLTNHPAVYDTGYSAANCHAPAGNVGPYVLIGNYYYTITAYSVDGAYELAQGNTGPNVVAF